MFSLLQFHITSYFLASKNCLSTSSIFARDEKDVRAAQELSSTNSVLVKKKKKQNKSVLRIFCKTYCNLIS